MCRVGGRTNYCHIEKFTVSGRRLIVKGVEVGWGWSLWGWGFRCPPFVLDRTLEKPVDETKGSSLNITTPLSPLSSSQKKREGGSLTEKKWHWEYGLLPQQMPWSSPLPPPRPSSPLSSSPSPDASPLVSLRLFYHSALLLSCAVSVWYLGVCSVGGAEVCRVTWVGQAWGGSGHHWHHWPCSGSPLPLLFAHSVLFFFREDIVVLV